MQAPTVNRNSGNVISPEATARADNPSNLRQQTEQPTQRSSHSLGSMGKRLLKSVGKVFQKSRAPRQSAARSPSTQTPSSSAPRSSREAGRNTGRGNHLQDNPAPRSDQPPKSILRTSANRANASGTTTHEIEEGSTRTGTAPRNNRRVTFNLPQDQLTHSASQQLSAEPMTDEEAVASAMRERRNPGSRLQGSDGTRQSMQPVDTNTASSSGTKADDPEEPLAPRNPGLEPGTSGRSALRSEQRLRNAQPQATVRLSADGKPDFSSFKTPGMAALLDDILAKPGQTYLAQQSEQGAQGHQLLQANGHLLHLAQDDSSLAVIRSSEPTLPVAGGKPPPVNMQREENHIHLDTLDGRRSQELPGKAHIAHLTEVHQTTSGDRLRVHEDRLYQFEPLAARWKPVDDIEDIAFNRLITGGNGSVYAKSDDVVVDLSSPFMPHAEFNDLKSFSVAPDDTAALLSGSDVQTVLLADMSPVIGGLTPKKTKALELDGGQAQAAEVALSNDRLFIADTQGRLYSTDRSAFESNDPMLRLMPERAGYRLDDQPMGGHNSVSGFISGDDGRVHALIRNRQGEVHSHALDEQGTKLESGWNLTNALVLDNTRGLTVMPAPTGADRLHLDRAGLVGLSAGRIQRWDATPQCWKDAGIKEVDRLQRGADSNAYVLKGGKLLRLDVAPKHPNVAFDHNTALAQIARSTKVAMGKEIAGLENRVVTAFAMVSDKRFVVLDDQNRLTAHSKDHKPIDLDTSVIEGDIKELALDEKHNLYTLSSTGKLYCMPREAWQATRFGGQLAAKWTPLAAPDGQPVKALYSNDDNRLSVQVEDAAGQGLMQLKEGQWQAFEQRPVEKNGLNDVYNRITRAHKTWRIPGTGLTAKLDINAFGRSGMEKSNRPAASEAIRANVYKHTLEPPRWMKNVGNNIQHRYHGREGLKELYKKELIAFKQLELIHEAGGAPPTPGNDLKARIARLQLGPEGAELAKELEVFRDELEKHARTALENIGKDYGKLKNLRQNDGVLNQHSELAKSSKRTQLGKKLAELGSMLNFKSSGHDFVNELDNALTRVAPSAENPTAATLKRLKDNGVKLSHTKTDIGLGQRRDANEDHGLSKARLALDLVTLKDLGALISKVELLTRSSDLPRLQAELTSLRDVTYGENPVKQVTDMGFTDNAALEGAYDAVKAFSNALKKSDHAVSVNMRAATGSQDQSELADTLKAMLKNLEHGDDEIGVQRSYGLNLTSPFAVLADKSTGPWPTAGATGNRNYLFSAERCEGGVTLYLMREAAGNISGGVGGRKDYWPGFFDDNHPARSVDIGNNRKMTPNFRLGGDVTATAAASQRAGVIFNVADDEIDGFVDDLFEGKLNPLQLLNKVKDHETYEARRFNFDITTGFSADMRVGFGLSEADSAPLSAVARLGVAANVTVNLLSYTDYSLTQKNDKTELREGGKNRPRFFNSLIFGGQARGQIGGTHTNATATPASAAGPTPATQSAANNLGVAANVTIDDKTVKRVKFRFNVATPMSTESLDKLSKSLAAAFKDKATTARLAALQDPLNALYADMNPEQAIQARLDGFTALFADRPSQNDTQYKALRDLKRAAVQHEASISNHSVLDNARFETSKTNLSGLSKESILTRIMGSIREASAPGNAARVAEYMRQDPTLSAMVKQLENSQGTLARVRLEPKDSLIDEIDEGSRRGTLTQTELSGLLENRNNMRIKRLVVFHAPPQTENFTSPTPLISYNSGASLSVNKTLGRINFIYGEDQDKPIGYTFDGELSRPSASLKEAAGELKLSGFEVKS
ncbi:AvrE family type 3 secretion system effector [Pseudomonas syringae]|uniref:Pathogenicity factor n=1 Tax=Pseudomonas syringae TaxID=317 RepID=A0AB37ZHB9_PSESX|nr:MULTISPECIES: AvrE-family type 3 secretion system effector [Pseudomonas]MBI6664954.1 AvrE-family type 3 secretion system effector [Pseudomonas syringae]MBI6675749.1 AvrE-family type 3 secretion system effector [Pseudomonas syringae]MBI6836586.1 AvrE-family type 3 secretion system effector [Pseudomonas syringae]NAP06713.1 AvrE-family type 3 secretion system effector [Pseudomonas syringae]NAP19577.1 AvrE-family type 3 secretion system effector [Pseudomonas syringae]